MSPLENELPRKRFIIAMAAAFIAVSSVAIALMPTFPVILGAQSFIGITGAVFGLVIAAITPGLLGQSSLNQQIGKNQSTSSARNLRNYATPYYRRFDQGNWKV